MYPSNQNTTGKSTDPASSSSPSAPLLPPSAPYNPDMKNNLEPPPYSAVVGQDSSDWKNRSNSFSSGTTDRPYPPASSYLNGANSTSGLQNQSPYPAGPPGSMGLASQPYPSFGTPAQPPYPVGPGSVPNIAGNAPYPPGPGAPGFVSQPPYPTGPSPMPNVQAPQPQIGFTAPTITVAPTRHHFVNSSNTGEGMQDGLIYPTESGPGSQYVQQGQYQYPNQYAQQPPQTVYVVQKNNEDNRSEDVDSCCLLACCLTSCYCLCECIKCCAAMDS